MYANEGFYIAVLFQVFKMTRMMTNLHLRTFPNARHTEKEQFNRADLAFLKSNAWDVGD